MIRTLVTGAAGFTGRYLTSLLAARGHEVHGVVHLGPYDPVDDAAMIHAADLADYQSIAAIVASVRPHFVVHLAAIAFVGHEDVAELYRANIVGTRQLLEALTRLDDAPRAVIVASSANVYGNAREGMLVESLPLAPANDYGVSKVAAEHVAGLYAPRLPLIVVRPFNYTGRGQSTDFLIPKIVDHALRRSATIELGNVEVARDFSDVRAVVDTYARLLDCPEAVGGTFNICSGRAVVLQEILELVQELTGHDLEVRVSPSLVRRSEVRTLWGSPAKLEAVIGKLADIPLRETLQWMIEAK